MKKLAALAMTGILAVSTLSMTVNAEDVSGTVVITGSTSVEKVLTALIDEFQAQNPDVDIQYTGSGSSAGINDTISGDQ